MKEDTVSFSLCLRVVRKRYEKAEAEYVAAKLDLHRKTDVKEQLTEHLCAIIQQNELRKAHKLEELMQELQLQATGGEEEEQEEEKKKKKGSRAEEQEETQPANGCVSTEEETARAEGGGGGVEQQAETRGETQENCVETQSLASWRWNQALS